MATLSSGCAHRATIAIWQPAEVDVSDLRKLAVLGCSGEHGDAVATVLRSRLAASELLTHVATFESQAIQRTSAAAGNQGLLSPDDLYAAHAAGIDGIIVGEVVEYRCDDHSAVDNAFSWNWTRRGDHATRNDGERGDDVAATLGELRQDAAVAVTFRLVEARSGAVRALRQTSHSFTGAHTNLETRGRQHADVLNRLTRQCVDEFVSTLAPHRITEPVTLARPGLFQSGALLVINGNEFASRGRWDEAIIAWKQAATRNPDNDAALFNLSLAYLNRQEFTNAENYAIQAMNVRHDETYQAGLQRIREQASALDHNLQQRRDLSMTAASNGGNGQ